MRFLFLSILMLGVGVGLAGCECDDDDGSAQDEEVVEETGGEGRKYDLDFYGTVTIVASGDDGSSPGFSGFAIVDGSNIHYDPLDSLPNDFRIEGLEVWVLAKHTGETSLLGIVIDIVEIRQR